MPCCRRRNVIAPAPNRIRWETKLSAGCLLLLAWWVWVTGGNAQTFWQVVLSLILGCGIGFGISGVRRGGAASRRAAGFCLSLHMMFAALEIAIAWLA